MPEPRSGGVKRPRAAYSRLICLGCRERRIRCELPRGVEMPDTGELRTVQTPCYRCRRLGLPCIVRQTVLGRPGERSSSSSDSTAAADVGPVSTGDVVSRVVIELPSRTVSTKTHTVSSSDPAPCNGGPLLVHTPQSPERLIIIRAVDFLRREKVENEWFRHLPAHVGHTQALDLSIKALVAACAYGRGLPKITTGDCYRALAPALRAVQADIKQSSGELNDDILASTALLAHVEGSIQRHGIPMRLHVKGLAAVIATRPATYPVTQLARGIFDFHACESAIMACIQGIPSPFESISRAYFDNNRTGYSDSDRAQLKAFGSELFIRTPRLVGLVRSLRLQPYLQNKLLLDAVRLLKSLLRLQDSRAEERLLQNSNVHPLSDDSDAASPPRHGLHFASVDDFEALAYYWQTRLSLLRLEHCLHNLSVYGLHADNINEPRVSFSPKRFGPRKNEMLRLAKNIIMCTEYARTLSLRKHNRLFAHALVVVWGAMMDVSVAVALKHIQVGEKTGTKELSEMLLQKINSALPVKPVFTAEDMNTAADIFVGGPLQGQFVELYGL